MANTIFVRFITRYLAGWYKYLLIVFCLLSLRFQQPSSYDVNAKIRAVFIYNFTRYFEWPEKKRLSNFVIYVVGKNESLISELKNLAKNKKVGTQDIEIKSSPSYESNINSHIIYFLPDQAKPVGEAAAKNRNKGALVVAESPGACRIGASINFVVMDNKLKFEYNKTTAERAGLKTNDDLRQLAAVNFD